MVLQVEWGVTGIWWCPELHDRHVDSLELGGSNLLWLLGFSDMDYAHFPDTSHSVDGYCFTLDSGMISWASWKQQHASDSTCYSEYIAMHEASHKLLFFRQFLDSLNMSIFDATPIYCNNEAASQLSEDQRWHAHIKHFRVGYHSIHDLVTLNEMKVLGVWSSDNVTDVFTKPLGPTDFAHLRTFLGICAPHLAWGGVWFDLLQEEQSQEEVHAQEGHYLSSIFYAIHYTYTSHTYSSSFFSTTHTLIFIVIPMMMRRSVDAHRMM